MEWNADHSAVTSVLMRVDREVIPSETWPQEEGNRILSDAGQIADWINDVLDWEPAYPDGLKMCIIDAGTREMIAGWQRVSEDAVDGIH